MEIRNLWKSFQVAGRRLDVLKGLDMRADDEGITVVLGRSGCGKTTLLRLIAGLEQADAGEIVWEGGRDVKLGVIFQEPRLLPWLTVADNILFGVSGGKKTMRRKTPGENASCKNASGKNAFGKNASGKNASGKNALGEKASGEDAAGSRLAGLLKLTGLEGFENARPEQLSGGMRQRVALARALAWEPGFLLMDEPFAALDYFTRRQMQRELIEIWEKEKKGTLFVTHSIEEALSIGTKIVILDGGRSRKEYDLSGYAYPRELSEPDMMLIKKDIIGQMIIEEGEETRL